MSEAEFAGQRQQMVAEIAAQTIFMTGRLDKAALDRRVMEAVGKVPRHRFVREDLRPLAYADMPLPSGHGKTISQPFIVALMTDLLALQPGDSVLEIGTGLGYQTAILAELARRIYSIEMIAPLGLEARRRLAALGYSNIEIRIGDGRHGWPEHAPFDKIIVTAAPRQIPPALLEQLKPDGRMTLPLGPSDDQQLLLVEKRPGGGCSVRKVLPVRFSLLDPAAD